MNGTLRMAFSCLTFTVWSEPGQSENHVVWHGPTAWFMKDIQPKIGLDYNIETELPEHEQPALAALAQGSADMSIDTWAINYQRSKFVDFSYTQEYFGVYIISGRNTDYASSNVVFGVFDDHSYVMLLTTLFAMVLTTWLIFQGERKGLSITTTLFYMIGSSFKQPLVASLWPKRNIGMLMVHFFSLYNTLICIMYSSVIISMLTKMKEPRHIDLMADLNRTENTGVRIFLMSNSYVPGHLKSSNKLVGFEDRIDYINIPAEGRSEYLTNILNSIREGSHVFINGDGGYLDYFICQLNKEVNETIFKRADFRASRYHVAVSSCFWPLS